MRGAGSRAGNLRAPGLPRRMACFVYEGVLLFGVLMTAGLVYAIVTQQRHALIGSSGLQALLFVVLAAYFVWFWTRHGQTLAMRTWRLRLVTSRGQPLEGWRALLRYLLAWLWFLPALAALHFSGLKGAAPAAAAVLTGVGAYAALTWLRPDRQFWHDAVCGTRLVSSEPALRS